MNDGAAERANAPNLILAGFMGTGKSTVGRLAAQQLGLRFVDTDAVVEATAGMSIPALFARGEAYFRRQEAAICRHVARARGQVIATGGGALLDPATRVALEASGVVVCLTASLTTIMARVGDSAARPLFRDRKQVAALLAARQTHYDALPHHVDTTGKSVEAVADEVIALWRRHK